MVEIFAKITADRDGLDKINRINIDHKAV